MCKPTRHRNHCHAKLRPDATIFHLEPSFAPITSKLHPLSSNAPLDFHFSFKSKKEKKKKSRPRCAGARLSPSSSSCLFLLSLRRAAHSHAPDRRDVDAARRLYDGHSRKPRRSHFSVARACCCISRAYLKYYGQCDL